MPKPNCDVCGLESVAECLCDTCRRRLWKAELDEVKLIMREQERVKNPRKRGPKNINLKKRNEKIVELVASGESCQEVAAKVGLSGRTIRDIITESKRKKENGNIKGNTQGLEIKPKP